jgi:UDP-N-acetyl-2-amino-2-deoxyglucuronate dehydrogenase
MPARPLRAAVIGCGRISRPHARDGFAGEFGVERTYASAQEMLERERPDIVSICTWPPHHADPTLLACQAGVKAILCEKPMAVDLADADRMIAAARASGTLLCINHQRRFTARYARARKATLAGTIGEITHIAGICNGDLLTDATHMIDLTRFLIGEPAIQWVFGAIDTTRRDNINPAGNGFIEWEKTGLRYGHHIEGGSLAIMQFANGVRANLETGNAARPGYQKFVISGTGGRIEVSGDRQEDDEPELHIRRFNGRSTVVHRFSAEAGNGGAMGRAVAGIVTSLRTGAEHTLRAESARGTLEAIMAIFASAIERRRVTLPFERSDSPFETTIARGELVIG